jgi:integrase
VRLRIENSKNKQARILPLTGRLREVIQDRERVRRLDSPAVFHHEGYKIGGVKKSWRQHAKKAGSKEPLVLDLRRCAARNLSWAGLPEAVAKRLQVTRLGACTGVTGSSIGGIFEKRERLQLHLESQDGTKVMPLQANQ